MMSKYIGVLQEHIEKMYPAQNKDQYQSISIQHIPFQKMYMLTKAYLQKFINVTHLCITFCDLRTLENFPLLPHLIQLDVSNNSLQGTFEYLIKNRSLEYINASSNYISDQKSLLTLKRFNKISICLQKNPICLQSNNISSLSLQHIKILKQPKKNLKNIFLTEHFARNKNPFRKNNFDNNEDMPMEQFDRKQHIMLNQLKILQRLSEDMAQNFVGDGTRQRQMFQYIRNRYRNREQTILLGDRDHDDQEQ